MHTHNLEEWEHSHDFTLIHEKGEKKTIQVLVLTFITMIVEIVAGDIFGSMALLADGWHMGTHVAAFAISVFAYRYARSHAEDSTFSFGTGKVSVLGGFASAVALAVVALIMALESVGRLYSPREIHFNEAIVVAVLGLLVNLASALILKDSHSHSHDHHGHGHDHDHHHHDHNLKAAYFHVIADAFTSLLAIVALFSGKYLGWERLDPVMGIVGALVIGRWSYGLVKDTSSILLDRDIGDERKKEIREAIEKDADNRVSDMHIWKVGPASFAAIISVVTHFPKNPQEYKNLLVEFEEISHVTIEVNGCTSEPCVPPSQ